MFRGPRPPRDHLRDRERRDDAQADRAGRAHAAGRGGTQRNVRRTCGQYLCTCFPGEFTLQSLILLLARADPGFPVGVANPIFSQNPPPPK